MKNNKKGSSNLWLDVIFALLFLGIGLYVLFISRY